MSIYVGIRENLASIKTLFARKDAHFQNVKEALTLQLVEKRNREEGGRLLISVYCVYVVIFSIVGFGCSLNLVLNLLVLC